MITKKYLKVPHQNLYVGIKQKELNTDEFDELMDDFVKWKFENSFFIDECGDYFSNDDLNIDKQYIEEDSDIIVNKLYEDLYTFYTNKLENDKILDIGDYDLKIMEV